MATTKITSPDLFNLESLNTALKLPSGTTAERPTSPSTGEWRYNTTTNLVEFWDGGAWRDLQSENIPPIASEHFIAVTWTGDGTVRDIPTGFKPDFVWIKSRSFARNNYLYDSTRGANNQLVSNTTDAQATNADRMTAFNATSFTVGTSAETNNNGETYVAWCWKANGGTTSSNTDGTTTSTVQANTKAEFSIVQWPQTAGASTNVGHGLNSAPDLIITKAINDTDNWYVYNSASGVGKFSYLNLSNGEATSATAYSAVDATTFTANLSNNSGINMISYCFASVAGYSSIGTYTGNGSTNGPIVNTGFEPAFLMTKQTNTTSNWVIVDNKRSTTNPRNKGLRPNTNDTESTVGDNMVVDFLTNGFQLKQTSGANDNGGTFLYIAFASDASAAPTLADSFANKLWTGNDSTNVISGLGFQPSFVWIKRRVSGSESHALYDMLRGINEQLSSDSTAAQILNTAPNEGFSSFDTDGFTLGNNGGTNRAPNTYVGWSWKANSIPTINTNGTIQSVVSANQAAGFSIVKFNKTTNSSTASTFGHGLGVAPEMIILKRTDGVEDWYVYNTTLGNAARIQLNLSDAQTTGTNVWGQTDPTSSVFTVESFNAGNAIAYCFVSISGFSKIGTYAGSASAVSVDTGFQASFVLIKRTDTGTTFWNIFDSARGGDKRLYPNSSNAETDETSDYITFDSDGFNVDVTSNSDLNQSGGTFLYMAFKENPTPIVPAGQMAFLTVAGGGSGFAAWGGGGGGAGGLRTSFGSTSGGGGSAESNVTLYSGTYTITVGAGGAGGTGEPEGGGGDNSNNGADSLLAGPSITTITSTGGGGAGDVSTGATGKDGGSGGGGSAQFRNYNGPYGVSGPGGAGTANQGFDGSTAEFQGGNNSYNAGGGGGGASAAGTNATFGNAGAGGDGLTVSITGSGTTYAGGGGGGIAGIGSAGSGGSGGGGNGSNSGTGTAGTANTGGGAGGTYRYSNTFAAGGSGIVVLRMRTSDYSGTTTGSPTITTRGEETILTYTGSGTYVHS